MFWNRPFITANARGLMVFKFNWQILQCIQAACFCCRWTAMELKRHRRRWRSEVQTGPAAMSHGQVSVGLYWRSKELSRQSFVKWPNNSCWFDRRGIPAKPLMNGYCPYEWGMEDPDDGTPPTTGTPSTGDALTAHASTTLLALIILLGCILILY